MRAAKTIRKQPPYVIKLPGKEIVPGPGTVPTSSYSAPKTIITEMIKKARKVSKEGIFDRLEENESYKSFTK